jgi:hypothetical protein
MKLTKKQCREIACKITNQEIMAMLEKAKNNIKDWSKLSNNSSKYSKGKIWNTWTKDFDVNEEYPDIKKVVLLQEYGEYVPFHLLDHKYPKPEKKKEKQIVHEEPVFNLPEKKDELNFESLDRLLKEVLVLECTDKKGIKCEICGGYFN